MRDRGEELLVLAAERGDTRAFYAERPDPLVPELKRNGKDRADLVRPVEARIEAAVRHGLQCAAPCARSRSMSRRNASTTAGWNWVPRQRRSSAQAYSTVCAGLYARRLTMTSNASAAATTYASIGTRSPPSSSG